MNKKFLIEYRDFLQKSLGNRDKYLLIGSINNIPNNHVGIYYKDQLQDIGYVQTFEEVKKFMMEVERLIDYLITNNIDFDDISLFVKYGVFIDADMKVDNELTAADIKNKIAEIEYSFYHLRTENRDALIHEWDETTEKAKKLIDENEITSYNDLVKLNLSFSVNDKDGNPIKVNGADYGNIIYEGIVNFEAFKNRLKDSGINLSILESDNDNLTIKDIIEEAFINSDGTLVSNISFDKEKNLKLN